MERDMLLTVLNEVLEELREVNKSSKEIKSTLRELEGRVGAFEQKEIKVEPPDLQPMIEKISLLPALLLEETVKIDASIRRQVKEECNELRKETTAGVVQVATVVKAWPQQGLFRTILWVFVIGVVYFLISQFIDRTHPYSPMRLPATDSILHMKLEQAPVPAQKPIETRERVRHKKSRKPTDTVNHAVIPAVFDTLGEK